MAALEGQEAVTASIANGEWREPDQTDLLFPKWPHEFFDAIIRAEKNFALTVTAGREPPIACATPIFACACLKVPTFIKSPRTVEPAWR